MKKLIFFSLFLSFSAFGNVPVDEIECFSDMSDGICRTIESQNTFKTTCIIEVMLTLKSGERVQAVYEGKSLVEKNRHAVFLNPQVKERAESLAYSDLYGKIIPFFSLKSCQ